VLVTAVSLVCRAHPSLLHGNRTADLPTADRPFAVDGVGARSRAGSTARALALVTAAVTSMAAAIATAVAASVPTTVTASMMAEVATFAFSGFAVAALGPIVVVAAIIEVVVVEVHDPALTTRGRAVRVFAAEECGLRGYRCRRAEPPRRGQALRRAARFSMGKGRGRGEQRGGGEWQEQAVEIRHGGVPLAWSPCVLVRARLKLLVRAG
jgi:hypothetical protein